MDDLTNRLNSTIDEMIDGTLNDETKIRMSQYFENNRTEKISKDIIECYVNAYYSMDMELEDDKIIIYTGDEAFSFDDYETAVDYFRDDILGDIEFHGLLNDRNYYNFFLSKEQLYFMGLGEEYEAYTEGMIEGVDEQQKAIEELVLEDKKVALEYLEEEPVVDVEPSEKEISTDKINENKIEVSKSTEEKENNSTEKKNEEKKDQEEKESSSPKQNKLKNKNNKMSFHERQNAIATAIDNQLKIEEIAVELGFDIEKNGKTSYKTRKHDSLILDMKRNKYHWNSQGITNKGVVDFWMRFKEVSFSEAIKELGQRVDLDKGLQIDYSKSSNQSHKLSPEERVKKLFVQLHENNYTSDKSKMAQTIAYLSKTRGINKKIVEKMIDDGLLYQTSDEQGRTYATFLGKDESGLTCSICKRSNNPNSKFRGDYSGCNYDRGWFYDPQFNLEQRFYNKDLMPNPNKTLLVFESSIEAMSYMSILKLANYDYTKYAYLSCGSIAKDKCVLETCKTYGYKKAFIMFNNDFDKENNPGKTAAEKVASKLEENGVQASAKVPEGCNDWNDKLNLYKEGKVQLFYEDKNKSTGIEQVKKDTYIHDSEKKSPKEMLNDLKNRASDFSQEKGREKSLER